jgi:hypothetical protein
LFVPGAHLFGALGQCLFILGPLISSRANNLRQLGSPPMEISLGKLRIGMPM